MNPNYLQKPDDLEKLMRGFRLLLKIAHAEAMDAYVDHSDTHPELDQDVVDPNIMRWAVLYLSPPIFLK